MTPMTVAEAKATRKCVECGEVKDSTLFQKCKISDSGYRNRCKACGRDRLRAYRIRCPWIKSYIRAKERCLAKYSNRYHLYGGRGIKFLLTVDEIKTLWIRDRADLMKMASIDRKNPDGDYEFKNCRFIEQRLNSSKRREAYTVTKGKLCIA